MTSLKPFKIEEEKVPTTTPEQLMQDCGLAVGEIACLVVDTEGCDCEIVGGFLDAGCRPALLIWEELHCDDDESYSLKQRLRENGYRVKSDGKDVRCSIGHYPRLGGLLKASGVALREFFEVKR